MIRSFADLADILIDPSAEVPDEPSTFTVQSGHGNKEEDEDQDDEDEYGDMKHKHFTQPHAYLKDTEVSTNDIYCQEFFLHAYSLLANDRKNFKESKEGMTYVRVKHHDKVCNKIIPLIKGPCGDLQKWILRLRNY